MKKKRKVATDDEALTATDTSRAERAIRHILLAGSPGAGKTTLSEQLGRKLKTPVVHLDKLPATHGHKFPGTDEAIDLMPTLTEPCIIEGAQVLGFPKKLLKGQDVRLLEPDGEALEDRLIQRGWTTAKGEPRSGEKARRAAKLLVAEFRKNVEAFKEKHPDYQLAESSAPTVVPKDLNAMKKKSVGIQGLPINPEPGFSYFTPAEFQAEQEEELARERYERNKSYWNSTGFQHSSIPVGHMRNLVTRSGAEPIYAEAVNDAIMSASGGQSRGLISPQQLMDAGMRMGTGYLVGRPAMLLLSKTLGGVAGLNKATQDKLTRWGTLGIMINNAIKGWNKGGYYE